ncbi:polysaccharide biosynthesis/export family protein [Granulicella sp. dw_53]|uniref:polysaccharide biosynthesis/export family protein n=1 Tax=Granulicella sp. dw_53 TaxID=2719792 RepID=UPI001BD50E3C|nr:polysaccharide biosynthesis/export family protein [Granulicella sp. dw_53]
MLDAIAMLFLLTSCSWAQIGVQAALSGEPAPVEGHSVAASAEDIPSAAIGSQYMLGVSDVIRVNVWKSADLSQTVTIGPDGFISLPLLGDIYAAGMTSNQLAKTLSTRLVNFVINAQVTVSVVDFRSRQVFVTGQVGKPGAYSLIAPITVLQLIAQAGGLNVFANRKGIFVLRGTKGLEKVRFNYTNALRGDVKQNINLLPGDTVIVP